MQLKELLLVDDTVILRIVRWCVLVAMCVSPGGLLLVLEQAVAVASYSSLVQGVVVVVLSIPYLFLGAITFLHPYKTMHSLLKGTPKFSAWLTAFGGAIWANLSVGISYALVHWQADKLNEIVSRDTRLHYMAVYGAMFSAFGLLFMINSVRLIATIKREAG